MMNQMYGFDGEVKAKYSVQMAELFTEVYNWLPLAHCLNHKVLVSIIHKVVLFAYVFIALEMGNNSSHYSSLFFYCFNSSIIYKSINYLIKRCMG